MMKMLSITPVFPSRRRPERGAFVKNLFEALSRSGAVTQVLAPRSLSECVLDRFGGGAAAAPVSASARPEVGVSRPVYFSIPRRVLPVRRWAERATRAGFRRAVLACVERGLGRGSDVVYGHFFDSGIAVAKWCRQNRKTLVVALGESDLTAVFDLYGRARVDDALRDIDGVISVSRRNETICRKARPDLGERLRYIPNGVDLETFRPMDRARARAELGLPADGAIALFCGHFIERKNPVRTARAVARVPGLRAVFLGQGPCPPIGNFILKTGPVPNGDLPMWYSAADVFVLPSFNEGLSNAMLEAMACGLPLVVSDRDFNRDFLDETCAEFVDPESVDSIAAGLIQIINHPDRRERMSRASLTRAQAFSSAERAAKIKGFFEFLQNRDQ